MARHTISAHEVTLWQTLKTNGGWLTIAKLHELTGIGLIAVRKRVAVMASMGLLEVARTFPSTSYRVKQGLPPDHPRVIEIERVSEALAAATASC